MDYRYNHKWESLLFLLIQVDGGGTKNNEHARRKNKQEKKYDLGVQNKKKGKK